MAVKHRALENPTEEICGAILRGEHIAIDNVVKDDQKARRFRMNAKQQMEVWECWRREGHLIIYHSHPTSGTYPSDDDKWVFTRSPDLIFLIYSVVRDSFNAYRWNGFAIVGVEIRSVEESTQDAGRGTVTNGSN